MELSDKTEAAGFYRSLNRFARRLRKGGTYMKGNLSRASRLFAVLLAASVTMAMSSACGSNKDPSSSAAPSGPEGSAVSDASYSDGSDVPSDVASQPDGSEVSEGSGGSDTSGGSSKDPQKPDTSSKGGQQGQTSSTTSGGGSSTAGKLAKDTVVNMGGYTFSIMSSFLPQKLASNSTLFEEQLFERIKEVQTQYNCKIKILNSPYPDLNTIKTYVLANSKFADIVELSPGQMVGAAQLGYITPWSKCSLIDPKDARWVEYGTKLGSYDGKQYGLQFYRPPEVRYCIVMNKTLLKANNINPDTIYDAVKNKTWTFEKLKTLAAACTDSGKKTYGIVGYPDYMATGFMTANGANLVTRSSGKASFTGSSNAAINAMTYLYNLVNTDKVVFTNGAQLGTAQTWDAVYRGYDPVKEFLKGKTAFLLHESWVLNQQIKAGAQDTNMEYGMVPYPIGPDAKDYTSDSRNNRLFTLIRTNKDYEKSAVIFNALARPLGDEKGLDYWDDIQADYFQTNDQKSLDMYKLCLEKATYDPGTAVNELGNAFNVALAESIYAHTTSVKGALTAMNGTYDAAINAIFNK